MPGSDRDVMSAFFRRLLLLMLIPSILGGAAAAQPALEGETPPALRPVRVGIYLSPPFVMEVNGRPTGMAIELWESLAASLKLQSQYVRLDTFADLVNATAAGDLDIAVTNLTITRDRAEQIDFTQPWFDSGLRVMVATKGGIEFGDVVGGLRTSGHLWTYAGIGAVIVAATILLTLFDRRFDAHFPTRWRDGIAESFYSVMSIATSGQSPTRKNLFGWAGRLWQGLWLACGIAVLAYVTSSVTSVMTTLSLSNRINGVADLSGRRVGVLTGSVGERYARNAGFDTRSFRHVEDAARALVDGRVSAVIADAPVLEYYAHNNRQMPLIVVGAIFEPDKYGFGLPKGSSLTRSVTIELIGSHETGHSEDIRRRYFGNSR